MKDKKEGFFAALKKAMGGGLMERAKTLGEKGKKVKKSYILDKVKNRLKKDNK